LCFSVFAPQINKSAIAGCRCRIDRYTSALVVGVCSLLRVSGDFTAVDIYSNIFAFPTGTLSGLQDKSYFALLLWPTN
jgi:hypothetical protein